MYNPKSLENLNHKGNILDIGTFDCPGEGRTKAYKAWSNLLHRCYNPEPQERRPTYIGCTVCDEWLTFSNFKQWFNDNYVDGYHLDKDIIHKGNKVYSPDNCCYVPARINTLIVSCNAVRGELPVGISQSGDKYTVHIEGDKKQLYLGTYSSLELAFKVYKTVKEARIQDVAQDYYNQGAITERTYNALLNYIIEIDD